MSEGPIEKEIIKAAKSAVKESIIKCLVDYSSPLNSFVKKVVSNHEDEFIDLLDKEVVETLNNPGFKEAIKDALHGKLAKTLVSKFGGELEKRVNELKQDPTTRAKITLAINNVVEGL